MNARIIVTLALGFFSFAGSSYGSPDRAHADRPGAANGTWASTDSEPADSGARIDMGQAHVPAAA